MSTAFSYLLAGYEQVVGKHDHAAAVCVWLEQKRVIDSEMNHALRLITTNVK